MAFRGRLRPMFALGTAILSIALASCGGEESGGQSTVPPILGGAAPTPSPAPAPVESPTPLPSPSPSPEPSPTPGGDSSSATLFMAEGDSISIYWSGNYTGIYAAARPGLEFTGTAVGGSSVGYSTDRGMNINSLWGRLDADLARRPTHMTVLIGANDLDNAGPWTDRLFAYTDTLRRAGVKVAVGTILPQCLPANPQHNALFSTRRAEANTAIRAAVGTRIDAVIDFAADPRFGGDAAGCDTANYPDGVHPSDLVQRRMAEVYGPAADALLRH